MVSVNRFCFILLVLAISPVLSPAKAFFHGLNSQITVDGGSIQSALDRAEGQNLTVNVTAGTYAQTSSLIIKSGTTLNCAAGAAITANSASWSGNKWLLTNENVGANSLTDHDITISGCEFSALGTFATDGGFHHIHLRYVTGIEVSNNVFDGGGDGTAFLASTNTVVQNNTMATAHNACWDHWEATSNITVSDNICTTVLYGILVTGTNTAHSSAGVADTGTISGNQISLTGTLDAGIWLNGLGAAGSGASNITVSSNTINGDGTVNYTCLYNTGNSQNNIFSGNTCGTSGDDSIGARSAAGSDTGGTPALTTFSGNTFTGIHTKAGNVAVVILKGAGDVMNTNVIDGGNYPYAFWLGGANNEAHCNTATVGTSGVYTTSGATSPVVSCP